MLAVRIVHLGCPRHSTRRACMCKQALGLAASHARCPCPISAQHARTVVMHAKPKVRHVLSFNSSLQQSSPLLHGRQTAPHSLLTEPGCFVRASFQRVMNNLKCMKYRCACTRMCMQAGLGGLSSINLG